MLRAISALLVTAQVLFPTASPSVSATDANARASGNLRGIAVSIGKTLFHTEWPAQVLNVYADGLGPYRIAGLHVSGVRFHHVLTRGEFLREIFSLVRQTFAASPVDEVDVWATVPLRVGKDIVVSGDLARPTSRTVFTVSARRDESIEALERRLRQGSGVFWDQDWASSALK